MDPRSRNMASSGQYQSFYDHSRPSGRVNAWLNSLPWNYIFIGSSLVFLVFLLYISIEPSLPPEPQSGAPAPGTAFDIKDWVNSSLLNNDTEYLFQGDGVHTIKFPGFDESTNLSSVTRIVFRNAQVDLPDFLNEVQNLTKLDSVTLENVTLSGTFGNQMMPKLRITFAS